MKTCHEVSASPNPSGRLSSSTIAKRSPRHADETGKSVRSKDTSRNGKKPF